MKFHAARWKPGSSALVIAGDITLADATGLATKDFGGWSGGAAPPITIPAPTPSPMGRIYLVDRPDAAQTVVAQYLPAPMRTSPDYDALTLVDAVWGGGGFGTRLNLNLREDKGYSYGVFSNFNPMRTKRQLVGRRRRADEQDVGVGRRVRQGDEGPGRRQADHRRTNWRGQGTTACGATRSSSSRSDASPARSPKLGPRAAAHGAAAEYDATEKLTLAQVLAAAKKYVEAGQLRDAPRRRPRQGGTGLKALNLGDVVVLDAEGKPVP